MKKRFLAMLLCVAMLLSMMPLGVVAEGETAPEEILQETVPAALETLPEASEPAAEETQEVQTEPVAAEEPTVPETVTETAPVVEAESSHNTREGYTKCGHGDENITWTPVTQASDIKTDVSGHYYLDVDSVLALSAPIAVSSNVDIVICLNGKNISAPTTGNVRRIFRIAGGSVTVCDCTAHTDGDDHVAGKLIPGISEGGAVGMYGAGTFTMNDVIIDGTNVNNTASSGGGAVIITSGGVVNINSGVIRNCTAQRGGAVYVYKGTLNMAGGTLTGNTSRTTGGAISTRNNDNDNGTVINITGGTITNNTANHGGGIFLQNAKSVLLQNVTITGNRANNRGGGVDNQTTSGASLVTVGGKTVIADNYVGKILQNLNLVNGGRTVAISTEVPLSEGACIGISTRDGQAAATNLAISAVTAQADANQFFTSDMGHEMTMADGKVTITGRGHNGGDYKPGHENVTDWKGTATLPTTTGHYYLTSDVYLTAAVGVSTAQDIVLCLNGYDIIQTGAARIYRLSGGAKLTICDCTAHTDADGNYVASKITGGNAATGGALFAEHEGTVINFYDGIITGNTTNGAGTIVNQTDATFNMFGGEISGNTITGNGGALYTNAVFNMLGGVIRSNTSAGAVIHIPKGTVNLSGGTIANNTVTGKDTGVLSIASGSVSLSGTVISGGSAIGIYITGGTVNMTGGEITGISHSANTGAAVTVKGGTFNLSAGEISGNTSRGILIDGGTVNLSGTGKVANHEFAAFDGAAVRVNSGIFTMTGGEISGNNSGKSSGAGIRVGGGNATLSGGIISGNTATNGAAVLVAGGNVTLSGVSITGNTVTNNGAVRIDGGTLNITGGEITGNTIGKWGAVLSNGGTLNVTGGSITANSAVANGGGLYIIKGNVTVGGNAVIKNNTVKGKTNNIYLPAGQSVALSTFNQGAGVSFTADLTTLFETGKLLLATNAVQDDLLSFVSYDTKINHSLKVQDNGLYLIQDPNSAHEPHEVDACGHESVTWKAWGDATTMPATSGHWYLTCDVDVASMVGVTTAEEITVCLNGFTVTANNRVYRLSNGAKLNICDCTAHTDNSGNYISGKLIPGSSKGGVVGLYKDAETDAAPAFTLYAGIIDGTGVTNESTGMAIRMEDHGIVNIIDGVIRGCTNPEGVITIRGGELNMSGGKITGNNARTVLVQNGTFNLSGGEISHNTFTKTEGVGVRVQAGRFHMTGGKIIGNDAGEEGTAAGIRIADGEVTISGGEISGNTAFKAPGMLITGGNVTIENGVVFTGNISHSLDSGTIHQIGGTAVMTGGEITGNQVRGLYISGTNDPVFTLSGGVIKNNRSYGRDGAGMRIGGGTFTMTGGEISGNDAGDSSSVGGLRVDGGTVKLLGGKISGNKANGVGGLAVMGGDVYTENFEISNNTAVTANGGGVYQSGGSLTLGKGTVVTGNSSRSGGGVFCVAGDLTIDGAAITGNTASHRGGGVDFGSEGTLTINGAAKITGNTVEKKTSNLVIVLGNPFVTDGLEDGCRIGFVTDLESLYASGKQLLGKGVAADELAYFTYDENVTHTMQVLEDGLYMIQDPKTIHAPHEKDECGHENVVWTAWTDTSSLPSTAGHYYLIGDVELKSMVAVSVQEEITLCLNGYTVRQTGEGQRIYRLSGGVALNLCDCTAHTDSKGNYISGMLTGGNTNASAGASGIYAAEEGTIFRLYSGKITGNKTEGSGGGVVAFKNAKFEMYGGEISNNTADSNGAGVYAVDAQIKLLGGKITGNTAKGEAGGVYCGNATALVDGVKITNNQGLTAAGGMTVGKESKVEFVSGEITGNKGRNGGGMVIQSKGYVNMTGGRIDRNNATEGNGGGVFVSRDGTFNLRSGSINGNTSKKTGGGLYICDIANIYGGSISGNHAGKEGGGMYITEASWKDENGVVQYSDGVVNMYGGTISGNTTSVSAAGVLVRGQRGYFNLRGGSITGNKALTQKSGSGHGGGIIAQGKGNLTMYGGSITNNEAHQTSGGIGAYSNATVKLYGGTISGNKAYRGAGVYLAGNDSIIDGVTITKNIAQFEGAGLYVSATKVTMNSGIISENELIDGNGAGVVLRTKAQMILNDGSITGNKNTEGHAGGILIQSDATLQMNGGVVAENYASLSGGGIRSSRCKVEILGGVIRDNISDVSGGGIYAETELVMKNCSVTGNRITGDKGGNSGGAGIYLAQQTKYEMENVTVSGNYAIGKAGGMQIGYRCNGTITGCTFTGNTASANGAGILVYIMGNAVVEDTVVEANTAVGNGGGVFVESDTSITMRNCAINKNSAKEGGALYVGTKGMADISDTQMRSNSALVNAGAVYANGGVYLTNVKISDSANKEGSAAVVLDNAGHDGESYIPSVNQFKGDVIISGNLNGDMMLVNDAFVNIHGDGLGDHAEIKVYQPDGGITDTVIGAYHYVREGDVYTITKGETSLNTPDPVTRVEGEATEPSDGIAAPEVSDDKAKTIVLIAFGGVFAVAVILAVIAIAVVRKNKKKVKNS